MKWLEKNNKNVHVFLKTTIHFKITNVKVRVMPA